MNAVTLPLHANLHITRHAARRTVGLMLLLVLCSSATAQQLRVELNPRMLTNEAEFGDPSGIVDEQREIIGPPAGNRTRRGNSILSTGSIFPTAHIWIWAS